MASNPTRKTEVQAYSFEVRRMNSALVRRDPVMLHDPLRTHSRATVVGVVLGIVGLLGFLIFGILKPNQQPPDSGIVIGRESGQIYVKTDNPEMLIPTFNLASARLILLGQQQKAAQGQGQGGPENIEVVEPTIVPDERLANIPRGRLQGIPGADVELPKADQRISDNWAVCHNLPLNPNYAPEERIKRAMEEQETAVLAGLPSSQLGKPLAPNEAIYVETPGTQERYLLYRPAEDVNNRRGIVRAQIPRPNEPDGRVIAEALRLNDRQPRSMSLGLLNAVEKVDQLVPPEPEGRGEPSEMVELQAGTKTTIGEVFVADPAGNAQFFVVLRHGKQRISQAAAELIRLKYSVTKELQQVSPDRLDDIPDAPEDERLDLDDYPVTMPTVIDMETYPTTCLGWELANGKGRTTLYVGNEGLPFPKRADGQPLRVQVGKANEERIAIHYFYMPPGRAAAVHVATSEAGFESGPIQLISDRGLRFGVPDLATAKALGLEPLRPAPASIVKLLPTGASLNVQDAQMTYDSFEPPPGSESPLGQDIPVQTGG
ncbi:MULTISPECIES: type VII secretion protein EccB [Thermocrispum]|jgi:type VII secretion protein EccB|uniref:Type VII secretion protein EccB n=1 Tax=Thermocrispum agreste TaxID=37925 RepID=A0A2W4L6A9_9PSEU|nr:MULTISPECIES: type VII secretion protein EccB [Thermocrispum]PZM91206.1 MAG: type VII secretion protein EccB [Thermocrispum agreste]